MATNWTEVEDKIRLSLEQLEKQRQKDVSMTLIYGTLLSLVFGIFLVPIFMVFGFVAALVAGYGIVYCVHYKGRNQKYKKEVVPVLVDAVCPGATYSPAGTFDKDIIKASRLYNVNWGEKFECEDTIRGKVDKTDFVFSEVELYHWQSNDKTTVKVVDFKGFAFEADFNKHFPGTTVVTAQRFRLTGNFHGIFSDMSRCKLEDPDFEKTFSSYTTNDQVARYILTPALQLRILEMNKSFLLNKLSDRGFSISFHEGRMLLMAPTTSDRLEVKYDVESVKKDFLALTMLIDIVDQLNLNLRIWTKE